MAEVQRVPAFAEPPLSPPSRICQSQLFIIFSNDHCHTFRRLLSKSSYMRFNCNSVADWIPAKRTWIQRATQLLTRMFCCSWNTDLFIQLAADKTRKLYMTKRRDWKNTVLTGWPPNEEGKQHITDPARLSGIHYLTLSEWVCVSVRLAPLFKNSY